MRFLLLNQFYPPDAAPTGQFLHDVACALALRGHAVRVLCSRRSYDGGRRFPAHESLDGVDIVRLPAPSYGRGSFIGKLTDYAGFTTALALAVLSDRPRPDLVLALTTPPLLGLAARGVAAVRGCRHAHWVMDVYPDVMAAHGMITAGGVAERALAVIARAELRGSALTLALGPVIARRVEAHASGPVAWVPLWGDAGITPWPDGRPVPLRAERGWDGDLVLMYSGNMGLGHRFREFLEAARRLGRGGPRWAFCGGGKRRAEVEAFARGHGEARVELHPYVARERLGEALAAGDVHLATLDAAWQGLMVPSKIQGIFAAGRPVIFVGGGENELAGWIREAGAGWVVAENDVEGLLAAIAQARDAGERARRGAAARRFAESHFDAATNVARIVRMLEEAAGHGGR
ncbi:MAG: group 1 glycosyl [Planctomycetota bacterium]|nr:MAG: group 1 glycosyl [Planctomycetota bacterium]